MPDRRPPDSLILREHEPTPVTVVERQGRRDWSRLLWWVPLVGVLVIGAGIVLGWGELRAHAQSTVIHPTPKAVVDGGGFAFRGDVQTALERALRETRLLRRDLRAATLDCEQRKGGGVSCKIVVPESE